MFYLIGKVKGEIINKYIDFIGLFVIGIFCLLYSIFYSNFAELHINFKFLPFPIFVGEILLAFCLVLLVIKWSILKIKFNFYHFILFIFIGFIIFKAFFGYFKWGALAFRNSALFYYPLFALLGYYFYNRDIFNLIWVKIFLILILSILAFLKIAQDYYLFTYCFLIAVLVYKLPYKYLRWVGILMAIIIFLKSDLFNQTKGMLVSILIVILYLIFRLQFLFKKTKVLNRLYPLFGVGVIVIILIASLKSHTLERIYVWSNWHNLVNKFIYYNQYIQNEQKNYIPRSFIVKLYEEKPKIYEEKREKGAVTQNITPKNEVINKKTRISRFVDKKQSNIGECDTYNILWRIFIWRDMFREVIKERAVFGLDFGKPLRPISIEILKWDIGDGRVGYLEPHNSYFHILYRSGLVGLIFIITFFWLFVRLIFHSVKKDKIIGILLSSALLYWLILSNFIVLLEFPYFAIPFWSLFGMSIAYIFKNTNICVE